MIIGGSASQDLAAKIAEELNDELCYVETKKFPDGEKYLRVKGNISDEVTIIQSIAYPQDENLMELLFLIGNLKDLGAKKIKVIAPYMGYARQEKRFNPGEAISARIVANLIQSTGADEFITINIHEKCVLDFFNIPARNISAMPAIAEYIKNNIDEKPIIVAPDKGAYDFAQEIAQILDCNFFYLSKVRLGPDNVETRIVDRDSEETVNINTVKNKKAIIIDDIIATGGTIANTINILKQHNAKTINVFCVHPILVNNATSRIYSAGAKNLISTDSISSDTSKVSLAKIIAHALR